jgi:hypothetical protein
LGTILVGQGLVDEAVGNGLLVDHLLDIVDGLEDRLLVPPLARSRPGAEGAPHLHPGIK